jgi:hypothetical protein
MLIILCKHNNAQSKTIDTLANTITLLQEAELKRHSDNPNAPSLVLYKKRKFNKPSSKFNFNKSVYNNVSPNFNPNFLVGP